MHTNYGINSNKMKHFSYEEYSRVSVITVHNGKTPSIMACNEGQFGVVQLMFFRLLVSI